MRQVIPILSVWIAITVTTACSFRTTTDPERAATIRKYEDWLRSQASERYGVGAPKSPQDVVFETDFRVTPERGLSRVHLKVSPNRADFIYSNQTNRLISPVFSDGVAAVGVPVGRWGYIDETGRYVIDPIFRRANNFDAGVATAQLGPAARAGTALPDGWVLIDKSGSMKKLDPSIVLVKEFNNGLAEIRTRKGLSGYIDRTGAITIPATFATARAFCPNGTAAVQTASGWGLVDENGAFRVQPAYDDIRCFSEGLAAAKKGKWGFVDGTGRFVISPQFDGVGDFSEELATFENRTWPYGSGFVSVSAYGFIDRTGAIVIPAKYAATYPYKFGIAKTGTRHIDWRIYPLSYIVPADPHYVSWTYIDRHGNWVASGGRH